MSTVPNCVKRKVSVGIVALAIFLLWPWIYMISCAGYTYLYWLFPTVHWAVPQDGDRQADNLPVPAIIHQTWKTDQVPEKWKKAQQSCIDLHPDYEYKLWTDAEGLKLIEVMSFLCALVSYVCNSERETAAHVFNSLFPPLHMLHNSKICRNTTHGSCTPICRTHTPFNVSMPFVILFCISTEAFTSI